MEESDDGSIDDCPGENYSEIKNNDPEHRPLQGPVIPIDILMTMPTVTDFPPPNRSRRTIFMDAVMNGVVPDDAIDPTADYVPNPEFETAQQKELPTRRTGDPPGRYTNLMDWFIHQILPQLEEHKDYDLFSDLAPKRIPKNFPNPSKLNRSSGLKLIKERAFNMYYPDGDTFFKAIFNLMYLDTNFYEFDNPKSIHVIYNRFLFERLGICMHEYDVPLPDYIQNAQTQEVTDKIQNLNTDN